MTWFGVWIEINLVYVGDGKCLDFRIGTGIDVVLVSGSKNTSF